MTKRPLAIFLLLVAFLLSAWGNVISAAFCPRYLALNCRVRYDVQQTKQVAPMSCHHEMADTKMDDMKTDDVQMEGDSAVQTDVSNFPEGLQTELATESSIDQNALDLPNAPCGHCWMHSQSSSGSSVAAVNLSPQSSEADAPTTELSITLPSAPPIFAVRMEHGPPGNSFPRHILINVFRI